MLDDLKRFQAHVRVNVDSTTCCHEWKDARDKQGYGQFSVRRSKEDRLRRPRGGNKRVQAHRWIYEQHYGPVASGYEIDHKCCNPSCVRLDHLQAITKAKNLELRGRVHLGSERG